MGQAARTLSALVALSSACEAPPGKAPPQEPAAVLHEEVLPAPDPTRTDPTLVASPEAEAPAPMPAAGVPPATPVAIEQPCYGSVAAPSEDLGSADEQRRIRLAIRESWQQQGHTHPDYVVAPTRSIVEVLRWQGATVQVRPASGPWTGVEVYLPTSCVARGTPVRRP